MVYFEKSQPAPSIKNDYNTPEVVQRLVNDFHNKCYICEQKESTSINVEHFVSCKKGDALRLDWNNLFLSCAHCNNIKSNKYNNLLNCTKIEDKVDTVISYKIDSFPTAKLTFKVEVLSDKATETKALLEKCFNGEHTTLKKIEGSNLRSALLQEIRVFQNLIFEYENIESDATLEKIKYHLSNKSAFTAFKRWIIIGGDDYIKNKCKQYIIDERKN